MQLKKYLSTAVSASLISAPVAAQDSSVTRSSATLEGEELGGGMSDFALLIGLVAALVFFTVVAANDDDPDDLPASP